MRLSSPRAFVYLITFALAVRRVLVKGVRSRLIPWGGFPEKFEGAGRRVLVMWLSCLLYLPFNLRVVAVAGLGLGDVVHSTFLAVNAYT